MNRYVFILMLALVSQIEIAWASDCDPATEYAKFECAKSGDNHASLGEFDLAKKDWQVSCAKGLASSCKALKQLESDPAAFQKKWINDPGYAAHVISAKQSALVDECTSGKREIDKCISEVRAKMKAGDSDGAKVILAKLCESDQDRACFELGGFFVRQKEYEKAVEPYMSACSLGNQGACTVLNEVQSKVKVEAEKQAQREQRQREIAAEKDRKDKEREFAIKKALDQISGANKQKGRKCVSTGTPFTSEVVTECHETDY